jgi:hypothetical protein
MLIPLHSFIDVITNSSSEIFVFADNNTLKAIQKLVDNLLKVAGSTKTSEELFEFDLVVRAHDENYNDVELPRSSPAGKKYWEKHSRDDESTTTCYVRVRPIGNPATEAKAVATTLSALTELFDIQSIHQ